MSTDRLDFDQAATLICDGDTVQVRDPDEAATWVAVVFAESGGNPVGYNLVDHDPESVAYLSTDNGLFQINSYWHGARCPVHEANRAQVAWVYSWNIATGNGAHPSDWSPWVAYRNGSYQHHLDEADAAVNHLLPQESTTMTLYEPAPGWDQPAAGHCRIGMIRLRDYLTTEYGANNLGCYADRPTTGGSRPSLHRDGRAIDIGFDGILELRDEAFEMLVEHADVLGVQMVLNYRADSLGGYRWRLPYYEGDTRDGIGTFAKRGHWLHIERTNAGADDPTPIEQLINQPAPPPPEEPMRTIRIKGIADQFAALPLSPDTKNRLGIPPGEANLIVEADESIEELSTLFGYELTPTPDGS